MRGTICAITSNVFTLISSHNFGMFPKDGNRLITASFTLSKLAINNPNPTINAPIPVANIAILRAFIANVVPAVAHVHKLVAVASPIFNLVSFCVNSFWICCSEERISIALFTFTKVFCRSSLLLPANAVAPCNNPNPAVIVDTILIAWSSPAVSDLRDFICLDALSVDLDNSFRILDAFS